jgi:hypothetical protein
MFRLIVAGDINMPQNPFLHVKLYQELRIAEAVLALRTSVTLTYLNLQYKENIV